MLSLTKTLSVLEFCYAELVKKDETHKQLCFLFFSFQIKAMATKIFNFS
jgi:hypothetical protein